MNNTQNADSTPAPTNGAPEAPATPETPMVETLSVTIQNFPRIVDVAERATPIKYGEHVETFPISKTETVKIDAYFFQSPKSLKLKKIKVALSGLKKAGVKLEGGGEVDSDWFNREVRDPFHKVLRFAFRYSAEHGTPSTLAFSRRKDRSGQVTVTSKHGFEHIIVPPSPAFLEAEAAKEANRLKAIADKAAAAAKQSDKPQGEPVETKAPDAPATPETPKPPVAPTVAPVPKSKSKRISPLPPAVEVPAVAAAV